MDSLEVLTRIPQSRSETSSSTDLGLSLLKTIVDLQSLHREESTLLVKMLSDSLSPIVKNNEDLSRFTEELYRLRSASSFSVSY